MPTGALGRAADSVKVINADTGEECPPAEVDLNGRVTNLHEAVGEIIEYEPSSGFEGYYKNEEATKARVRDGWYWSATSPTEMETAGSTSPVAATSGYGSTGRTGGRAGRGDHRPSGRRSIRGGLPRYRRSI